MPSKQASDIVVKVPKQLVKNGRMYHLSRITPTMELTAIQKVLDAGEKQNLDMMWARIVINTQDQPLDIGTVFYFRQRGVW